MPLARRLSSSSHEAFTEFCIKNQPLSRRLSSNGDAASISSSTRRESISKDRGQRVLKRRNQSRPLTRARVTRSSRSAVRKDEINISSPEPKKQRTSRSRSKKTSNKENEGAGNNNAGALMMSPTPYWKVSLSQNKNRSIQF